MADAIEEQRAHAAGPRPAWTYWRFAKEASARKARRLLLWSAALHFHSIQHMPVLIACNLWMRVSGHPQPHLLGRLTSFVALLSKV